MTRAEGLSHAEFADLFIDRITLFVQERPAFLKVLASPIRFRRDPAARKASRVTIANAFRAKNPSLSIEQAVLAANVTMQIVRGMMAVYEEAEPKGKVLVVAEFKKALTLYLGSVLSRDAMVAK
jgi:hypothetical protein